MKRKILKINLYLAIVITIISLVPLLAFATDTLSPTPSPSQSPTPSSSPQANGTTADTPPPSGDSSNTGGTLPPTQDNGTTAGDGTTSGDSGGTSAPAPVHLNIEASVDVSASCSATDTDGAMHNHPKGNSYLTICALETAISNGAISNAQFSNQFPSLGLFVTAINNVVANPNSQYWALYQNGSFANSGIALLPVVAGDVIMLQLHDFSDNNLGDQITLDIHSLVNDTPSGGGGGGIASSPTFDIQKALTYLKSTQGADGSFGNSILYTDWAGIALESMNVNDNSKNTLLSYFNSNNSLSSLLTDNERHAMALLSLGQNPYSFNGVNYINAITSSFDGTQFGDANLINDDIFALIPLKNSGYTASDDTITKDVAFIISKQETNGSWENSVDLTAATVQVLKSFDSITGVANSLSQATNYLISAQNSDGGWGNDISSTSNVSSTSWAMQAMSALSTSWTKNNKTGIDYLGGQQTTDGAVSPSSETLQNRIWATSYAIVAGSSKSWSTIMQTVSKPTAPSNSNSPSNNNSGNTPTENNSSNTPNVTPIKNTINVPITDKFKNKNIKIISQNKQAVTTSKSKVAANTLKINSIPLDLSAAAVNVLPIKNTYHTLLIIAEILSGIVLLYLIIRFWIK